MDYLMDYWIHVSLFTLQIKKNINLLSVYFTLMIKKPNTTKIKEVSLHHPFYFYLHSVVIWDKFCIACFLLFVLPKCE